MNAYMFALLNSLEILQPRHASHVYQIAHHFVILALVKVNAYNALVEKN